MDYKFCPLCAGGLVEGTGEFSEVPICQKCGFKFFQNSKPTAVALIKNDSDEILLVKRAHNPSKGKWSPVGGFLNPGEEPEDGLRREVREELNVEVKNVEFFTTITNPYLHNPSIKNAFTLDLYYSCDLIGEPSLSEEVSEIKWFAQDKIPWDEIAFESNRKALIKYLGIDKISNQ